MKGYDVPEKSIRQADMMMKIENAPTSNKWEVRSKSMLKRHDDAHIVSI